LPNKILVVDDSESNRILIRRLIEKYFPEAQLLEAPDAEAAWLLAQDEDLDCAILDVRLPGESGIDLCRRLKTHENTAGFPVLLISSMPRESQDRLAGLDAGADDYIGWPVDGLELVAKIRVMMRIKHAEDELRLVNKRLADLAEQRSHEFHGIHQRYRHMLEAVSDGVVTFEVDLENQTAPIREVNDVFCKMLSYSHEEIYQKRVIDIVPEERHGLLQARIESIFSKKQLFFETALLARDGRRIPVAVNAKVIHEEGKQYVLLVCQTVASLEDGRGAEPSSSYRILARETGQLIYEIDLETMQHRCAGAVKQITGLDREDLKLYQGGKWFHLFHPDDRQRVKQAFQEALESVGKYAIEYRFKHKTEGYRMVEDLGMVLPNKSGVAYRVVGTVKDISARVQADEERRRVEREQQHSQRLESLGILAGGIAHDFNNILAGIIGLTDLALKEIPQDSELYEDLSEALRGGHRAKELVRQILAFSRQSGEERQPIYLHLVAREGLRLIRATLPSSIQIIENIDVQSGAVLANNAQLHQVLTNFCTNAAQAMPHGGKLEITVQDIAIDASSLPLSPRLRPGPYVLLRVRDSGHGMSPSVLERIFDPFFTTKGPGEGTGMGLAVVHGIVADHDGVITAESKPGQGATFYSYFPRTDAVPAISSEDPPAESPSGGERILLVDDEETVLRLGLAGLPRLGYHVTGYSDPRKALTHFRDAPNEFDIVVTDYMMPHLTGDTLATFIHEIRSEIPVILFTGFSNAISEEEAHAAGISEVVLKPVIIQELATAIRRALNDVPATEGA